MAILYRHKDAHPLRKATAYELRTSLSRSKSDGSVGVFQSEGVSCYVVEEPEDKHLLLLLEIEWSGNSDDTECPLCRSLQWNGHNDHCALHKALIGACTTCMGSKTVPVEYVPETYVTADMASDAGDPSLAGSVYYESYVEYGPCPNCK